MDDKILLKIYESLKSGKMVAMAVITEEIGSSPRKSGSIMAVWQNGSIFGTVGGGKIEYTIIQKALWCMENKEDFKFDYNLTEIGMQCGGTVKGYIKVFYPSPKLVIVGAGHIGENLNKIAKNLNFYTVIIDQREEFASKERFQEADEIIVSDIKEALLDYPITQNDYIVIVSNGHVTDKEALKAVITKNPAYIGMIGSTKKIIYVMKELMTEGIPKEELEKVYTPIGLNISSNTPEEIAFGILSEILLIKNKGSLHHRKDLKRVWE